jgi:hypothetical protein
MKSMEIAGPENRATCCIFIIRHVGDNSPKIWPISGTSNLGTISMAVDEMWEINMCEQPTIADMTDK